MGVAKAEYSKKYPGNSNYGFLFPSYFSSQRDYLKKLANYLLLLNCHSSCSAFSQSDLLIIGQDSPKFTDRPRENLHPVKRYCSALGIYRKCIRGISSLHGGRGGG